MTGTYKIIRFYQNDRRPQVQRRGLTEAAARAWCNDPETSSQTARKPQGCNGDQKQIDRWNIKQKHWFDGYSKEGR